MSVVFGDAVSTRRTVWIVAFCDSCGELAHVTVDNSWCFPCRIALRRMQQEK
jgi:hypothetical protein